MESKFHKGTNMTDFNFTESLSQMLPTSKTPKELTDTCNRMVLTTLQDYEKRDQVPDHEFLQRLLLLKQLGM